MDTDTHHHPNTPKLKLILILRHQHPYIEAHSDDLTHGHTNTHIQKKLIVRDFQRQRRKTKTKKLVTASLKLNVDPTTKLRTNTDIACRSQVESSWRPVARMWQQNASQQCHTHRDTRSSQARQLISNKSDGCGDAAAHLFDLIDEKQVVGNLSKYARCCCTACSSPGGRVAPRRVEHATRTGHTRETLCCGKSEFSRQHLDKTKRHRCARQRKNQSRP